MRTDGQRSVVPPSRPRVVPAGRAVADRSYLTEDGLAPCATAHLLRRLPAGPSLRPSLPQPFQPTGKCQWHQMIKSSQID